MNFRISTIYTCLLAAVTFISLTSCGDLEQNLVINPDGSGTLETSMDLGEMMSMMQGMGEMGDLMNEDVTISGDTEIERIVIDSAATDEVMEPEEATDPMQMIMDRITNPAFDQDFDTLIAFTSVMPDSVRETATRLDLLDKVSLRMRSPANSSSLNIGMVMNFDDKDQLNEIVNYIGTMDNESSSGVLSGTGRGLAPESFLVFDADLKNGWIRFDSIDYRSMVGDMSISADSTNQNEDMAMLEMMFGNSKIKSVIHVPGDVTSCTNANAILTKDNKVIVEYDFLDVVKKGKVPGYTIYFTPNK